MRKSGTCSETPDAEAESEFIPMTAAQANQWRMRHPRQSMWRVVRLQIAVGLVCVAIVCAVGGLVAAKSAAYGALTVILPAALFVRGVGVVGSAGSMWVRFCVWELAKVGLTVAMLVLSPRLIDAINWLALVFGMVVTMKAYWLAIWLQPKASERALTN
jgi:ATP synthase protein I